MSMKILKSSNGFSIPLVIGLIMMFGAMGVAIATVTV